MLRAWDVLNQWADEVEFLVVDEYEPILEQLQAYPNPFTSELHFNLHHNQKGGRRSIRLDIINNQGQTVWTWNDQNFKCQFNRFTMLESATFEWLIAPGFYHARVTWKTLDGKLVEYKKSSYLYVKLARDKQAYEKTSPYHWWYGHGSSKYI